MRIAWCTKHRGVMRISFFNPKPPHFSNPCPRPDCQGVLIEQIRNKYELVNPGAAGTEVDVPLAYDNNNELEETTYPDEQVTSAPTHQLCSCCEHFKVRPEVDLCGWCIDCPSNYCDVPTRFKDYGRY